MDYGSFNFCERETCFFYSTILCCCVLSPVTWCEITNMPVIFKTHIIHKNIELQEGLCPLFKLSHRIPNTIHKLEDDMCSEQCLFYTSLAVNFGNVFQLLGEWSMQGLGWALQPVGDVCCSTSHVFKGQGLFSDSAPEDEQCRSPGVVKGRKKRGQIWRET